MRSSRDARKSLVVVGVRNPFDARNKHCKILILSTDNVDIMNFYFKKNMTRSFLLMSFKCVRKQLSILILVCSVAAFSRTRVS